MGSDIMLVTTSILLAAMISALSLYYQRISRLRQEYENAKGTVDNVIVSVDNQFRRQANVIHFVTKDLEALSSENKQVAKRIEEHERRLSDITESIKDAPNVEEKFSGQLKEVRNEVFSIKEAQNRVMEKLIEIERTKQEAPLPEVKIEAAIPIKKEKALEPLTETELMVLETIGREGEKTAPEIKERISLTREHTARLMKKLYKDGYLERDTHKMPYVYRLKEEMKKILKKREVSSS